MRCRPSLQSFWGNYRIVPSRRTSKTIEVDKKQTILFCELLTAKPKARKTCVVCGTAQNETGLCASLSFVIGDSSVRMKWHAGFGVEHCLLLNAEAPLSVDRRSLRNRKIFFIKKAIRQCINHPDCCYAGLCFTSIPRYGAL
jgi:hypothetical protein